MERPDIEKLRGMLAGQPYPPWNAKRDQVAQGERWGVLGWIGDFPDPADRIELPILEMLEDESLARLIAAVPALLDYADALESRHQEHLRLIRKLSTESISPEDAAELQAQVAALVSQVGTCRGYVRELLEILDDTCAKKWRARLAEIRTEEK